MAEHDDAAQTPVPGTGGEVGATRGTGEPDDADRADVPGVDDRRAAPSTEYTANTDPEPEDLAAAGPPRAADVDPHEPPGQG